MKFLAQRIMRLEEVQEFYEKELLYYTCQLLLLRGMFYFQLKRDEDRASLFLKRAELLG